MFPTVENNNTVVVQLLAHVRGLTTCSFNIVIVVHSAVHQWTYNVIKTTLTDRRWAYYSFKPFCGRVEYIYMCVLASRLESDCSTLACSKQHSSRRPYTLAVRRWPYCKPYPCKPFCGRVCVLTSRLESDCSTLSVFKTTLAVRRWPYCKPYPCKPFCGRVCVLTSRLESDCRKLTVQCISTCKMHTEISECACMCGLECMRALTVCGLSADITSCVTE